MSNEKISMKNREISLLNLIVDILLHWRSIIVAMLVGALLMGVVSYVKSVQYNDKKAATDQKELEITKEEDLRSKLTKEQLASVDSALAYRKLYVQYAEGQDFDYFDVNNFMVYTSKLMFWIESPDEEQEHSYNIARVYKNIIADVSDLAAEVPSALITDAITVSQETDSNVLYVVVKHNDEAGCDKLAVDVKKLVEEQHKQLTKILGSHEVTLVSQAMEKSSEEEIITSQRSYINKVVELKNAYTSLENAMSQEETAYYEYLIAREEQGEEADSDAENAETVQRLSPSVSVKYVLLGMILFALGAVFVIFLLYIFNNKLRQTDNLQDICGVSQLGNVRMEKRRKVLGFVDSMILKLCYRGKRQFSKAESIDLAAVAVKMTVRKNQEAAVGLIGCNLKENTLEVCNHIRETLEKEGVSVKILNNILYDAEAMESLVDLQGAVLIETAGSTLYEEMVSELELLARQNINVLGGIIVG